MPKFMHYEISCSRAGLVDFYISLQCNCRRKPLNEAHLLEKFDEKVLDFSGFEKCPQGYRSLSKSELVDINSITPRGPPTFDLMRGGIMYSLNMKSKGYNPIPISDATTHILVFDELVAIWEGNNKTYSESNNNHIIF